MTDPIAASILSKLTSWYDFDGTFNDSHGPNDLTAAVSPGFGAGKTGQYLLPGARAMSALADPSTITASTAVMTTGGWFNFAVAIPEVAPFGLTTNPDIAGDEIWFIGNEPGTGHFYALSFDATGLIPSKIIDPHAPGLSYPITVHAHDAKGSTASSPQTITIAATAGLAPGWYFVVATYDRDIRRLYVNAEIRISAGVPASIRPDLSTIQVANHAVGTVSPAGLEGCFVCTDAAMTPAEVTWLFNNSIGRSYADILALAS